MNAIDDITAWWAQIDPIEDLDVPDEVWDAALDHAFDGVAVADENLYPDETGDGDEPADEWSADVAPGDGFGAEQDGVEQDGAAHSGAEQDGGDEHYSAADHAGDDDPDAHSFGPDPDSGVGDSGIDVSGVDDLADDWHDDSGF